MPEADPPDPATYPPLDVPKSVAESIWIVDSGPLRVLGAPLPVRMTVIRLANGDLWLHSPTRYDENLRRELEKHGRIRHLVAPDIAHWTFLQEWQQRCPDAATWAAPGLRDRAQVKKSGVRLDRDLGDAPPPEWAGDMKQTVVPGAGFAEVAFFHKPSRTLVLTDIVQNLEPEKLPTLMRQMARLNGVLAPDGKPPIYLRLALRVKRQAAAAAVRRMLAWNPERVIFSHGRWFDRDGAAALRRSFRWLV
jgi:Domain of unknown function (DUF4336)